MDRAAHLHRLQPYRPPEAPDTFDEFHCKMRELLPLDVFSQGVNGRVERGGVVQGYCWQSGRTRRFAAYRQVVARYLSLCLDAAALRPLDRDLSALWAVTYRRMNLPQPSCRPVLNRRVAYGNAGAGLSFYSTQTFHRSQRAFGRAVPGKFGDYLRSKPLSICGGRMPQWHAHCPSLFHKRVPGSSGLSWRMRASATPVHTLLSPWVRSCR